MGHSFWRGDSCKNHCQYREIVAWMERGSYAIISLSEEIQNSHLAALQLKRFCETLDPTDSLDVVYIAAIDSQVRKTEPLSNDLEKIVLSVSEPAGRLRKKRWMKSAHRVASVEEQLRRLRFATLEVLSVHNA